MATTVTSTTFHSSRRNSYEPIGTLELESRPGSSTPKFPFRPFICAVAFVILILCTMFMTPRLSRGVPSVGFPALHQVTKLVAAVDVHPEPQPLVATTHACESSIFPCIGNTPVPSIVRRSCANGKKVSACSCDVANGTGNGIRVINMISENRACQCAFLDARSNTTKRNRSKVQWSMFMDCV